MLNHKIMTLMAFLNSPVNSQSSVSVGRCSKSHDACIQWILKTKSTQIYTGFYHDDFTSYTFYDF